MKTAVILAGGKGTRLKPYTLEMPKPLVPINQKPILEHILINLKRHGFSRIILTLNHMADMIRDYFGDGTSFGLDIEYTLEHKPLSTMGPLKLIENLPEDFLVMNGDVLTDLDFSNFYTNHVNNGSMFSISSFRRIEKIDYGVLQVENSLLKDFSEKPSYEFLVSMGVYALNLKVLDFIPKDTFFGFDHLVLELIRNKKEPFVQEHSGTWLDIGRPEDYEEALNNYQNYLP